MVSYYNCLSFDTCDNWDVFISDPIIVEILLTTLMTIPWSIFMYVFLLLHDQPKANEPIVFLPSMWSIHKRYENRYLSTFRGEIIGLSILWIFWTAGAAGASVSGCIPPPITRTENPNVCLLSL